MHALKPACTPHWPPLAGMGGYPATYLKTTALPPPPPPATPSPPAVQLQNTPCESLRRQARQLRLHVLPQPSC
jgi:hypothetical protein